LAKTIHIHTHTHTTSKSRTYLQLLPLEAIIRVDIGRIKGPTQRTDPSNPHPSAGSRAKGGGMEQLP
jgi:hypothetical protein